MSDAVDALVRLYESEAATAAYDEAVTEREHALQAAQLAEADGASEGDVAAALLHDVGRLLLGSDPGVAAADRSHEQLGERHLSRWFGPEVTAPVGLHVAAKRYLCATEPAYREVLSTVSVRSLEVQGGPMSPAEVDGFRHRAGWETAVRLRRWDDRAKEVGRPTRAVADYAPLLRRLAS